MPQVVVWYHIYIGVLGLMALIDLILTPFMGRSMLESFSQMPNMEMMRPMMGLILVVSTVLRLITLFGAIAAFVLPRRPGTWIYHLVYMCVATIFNCCCIPFAIPIIIFWVKPATQRWYGRNP